MTRISTNLEIANRGQAVSSPKREFYPTTITGSASEALDLKGAAIVGIHLQADGWTDAKIAFSLSMDGVTFYPARNSDGTLAAITVSEPAAAYAAPIAALLAVRYVKLLSVDATGAAVAQASDRGIILVTAP